MATPIILTPDKKTAVDQLIADTLEIKKDWSKLREHAEAFVKRFEELNIDGDPLVEDHKLCRFRYLPLSIHLLVSINDTTISDAYYKTYGNRINKEFVYANGDVYNYLQTFYDALSWASSYPTTDNMIGAIFHLQDLSFFKSVAAEHKGGKAKAVQWLQFLDHQIDHYMEDEEEKELFRKGIKAELSKAQGALLEYKKADVFSTMSTLISKLSEINDPMFSDEVKKKFLTEIGCEECEIIGYIHSTANCYRGKKYLSNDHEVVAVYRVDNEENIVIRYHNFISVNNTTNEHYSTPTDRMETLTKKDFESKFSEIKVIQDAHPFGGIIHSEIIEQFQNEGTE